MSFGFRYEDTDKLEVFLGNLETDCRIVGETIQNESAKVIKARVVGQLDKLRTKTNKADYKHMADDVIIRTVRDQYGDMVVRVRGGGKTGTLWHIVNDGTYRSNATHFMDKALSESESEIENIIDTQISKRGFE